MAQKLAGNHDSPELMAVQPSRLVRSLIGGITVGLAVPAIAVVIGATIFSWRFSPDPVDWFEAMQGLGAVWAASLTLVYLAITLPLVTTALAQARAAQASAEAAKVQAQASKVQADANSRMLQLMIEERREEKHRLWMPLKVAVDDRIEHIRLLRDFLDKPVNVFASNEKNTAFNWYTEEFEGQLQIAMGLIPQYSQTLRTAREELREMDRLSQAIKMWVTESSSNQSEHNDKGARLYGKLQDAAIRARHQLLQVQERLNTEAIPHDHYIFPEGIAPTSVGATPT